MRAAVGPGGIDATTAERAGALPDPGMPGLLPKGPIPAPRPHRNSDIPVPPQLQAVREDRGFVDHWAGAGPKAGARCAVSLYCRGPARTGGLRQRMRPRPDGPHLHHSLGLVTDPAAPVRSVLSSGADDIDMVRQRVCLPGEAGRGHILAHRTGQDGPTGAKALDDRRRGRRIAHEADARRRRP